MALRKVSLLVFAAAGLAMAACGHDEERAGVASGFGLYYNDQGETAALAYGKANSDDVGLMLQCVKGSGRVEVTDVVRKAPAPTLILASDGARSELAARIEPGESDAARIVAADTRLDDRALTGFHKSGSIHVAFGQVRYGVTAAAQERPGVERFFAACRKA